jgi:hypothetical protein
MILTCEVVNVAESAGEPAAGCSHERSGNCGARRVAVVGVGASGAEDDELNGHGVAAF